jgi:anaerobic magnesium-protoporphyrin IX monomethyl ester cyclase
MAARTEIVLISFQPGLEALGARGLHASMLQAGVLSSLLFLPGLSPDDARAVDEVARFVAASGASLVGLSLMSVDFDRAVAVTRRLRAAQPRLEIVWGGIHPSIDPRACLEEVPRVCLGEGEEALLELCQAVLAGRDPAGIRNLWSRGEPDPPALRPLIQDLDSLPVGRQLPRRGWLLEDGRVRPLTAARYRAHARYRGAVYGTITSRGCPQRCSYCCNNALARLYPRWGVRRRGVEPIIAELERARRLDPGLRMVNFHDDSFLARSREELEAFCDAYGRRVGLPFIARALPTQIDRARLVSLKRAGLAWISLGLQSGSHRTNELYQRRGGPDDFERAAALIHEQGLAAFYDVILDNPFESDRDVIETARVLARTPKPFFPQLFSLTLYDGTDLQRKALERGVPGQGDPRRKDYHAYAPTPANQLVRAAAYLGPGTIEPLLRAWERDPGSPRLRLRLAVLRAWTAAVAEPGAYLRLIHRAHGRRVSATLGALPTYLQEGLARWERGLG